MRFHFNAFSGSSERKLQTKTDSKTWTSGLSQWIARREPLACPNGQQDVNLWLVPIDSKTWTSGLSQRTAIREPLSCPNGQQDANLWLVPQCYPTWTHFISFCRATLSRRVLRCHTRYTASVTGGRKYGSLWYQKTTGCIQWHNDWLYACDGHFE